MSDNNFRLPELQLRAVRAILDSVHFDYRLFSNVPIRNFRYSCNTNFPHGPQVIDIAVEGDGISFYYHKYGEMPPEIQLIRDKDEQIEVRPYRAGTEHPRCVVCHEKLRFRRATPEEQISQMQWLLERFNVNLKSPDAIELISEPCICGQPSQVFYKF